MFRLPLRLFQWTPLGATACALLLACGILQAAEPNWPQFRGPDGSGVAEPSDPPVHFGPETGVLWKVPMPSGNSSPCIWGDRIFLTGYEQSKLETLCLRRSDGVVLWRQAAPSEKVEATHTLGNPATPTAATDGTLVYVYFGSFGLIAYDFEGKEQWRAPLRTPVVEFGTSSSPILAHGVLYLVCDQDEGSYLLATDARTGHPLWRVERPEFRRSFATPFLWRHDDTEELIVPGSIWLKAYAPADGHELWTYSGTSRVACSSPAAGDGMLYSASWNVGGDTEGRVTMAPFEEFMHGLGKTPEDVLKRDELPPGAVRDRFSQMDLNKDGHVTGEEWEVMRAMFAKAGNAVLAIRAGGKGDITATHLAWKATRNLPYVSSPLFYQGRLYTMKSGGLASCYDAATGKAFYEGQRVGAFGDYYASAVAGHGRIYLASQNGTVLVLEAGESLKILARAEFHEQIMATPAIVGEVLYVRTAGNLYALREETASPALAKPDGPMP